MKATRVLFICLCVALAIALSATGLLIYRARSDNARAWHLVLCLAESEVIASNDVTAKQKIAAIKFYDKALALVNAPPCPLPHAG